MSDQTNAITHAPEPQQSPMAMIQRAFEVAIASGQGLEVVDRILAEQRAMLQRQDEIDFQNALRRIQDRLKPIPKRGQNPETHSRYATIESIDSEIETLLEQERMVLSFEPRPSDKPEMILIVGVLGLAGTAYKREYPLEMPADGRGAKGGGVMSRTHATGSAITYAKRYLKNMIFNLRFAEKDDDGNRAGGGKVGQMNERDQLNLRDNISQAPTMKDLERFYLAAIKEAERIGDPAAIRDFIRLKEIRFGQLRNEARK